MTTKVPDGGSTTDARGNKIPTREEVTVIVSLNPATTLGGALERLPGADEGAIPVRGELLKPLQFPTGVSIGSVFDVVYNGYGCKMTLVSVAENDLEGIDFGSSFEGSLKYP